MSEPLYYIDLAEEGWWLIRSKSGERYTAGDDKQKVIDLIDRLNKAHRPNILQNFINSISVCWNNHEKHEDCNYEHEI